MSIIYWSIRFGELPLREKANNSERMRKNQLIFALHRHLKTKVSFRSAQPNKTASRNLHPYYFLCSSLPKSFRCSLFSMLSTVRALLAPPLTQGGFYLINENAELGFTVWSYVLPTNVKHFSVKVYTNFKIIGRRNVNWRTTSNWMGLWVFFFVKLTWLMINRRWTSPQRILLFLGRSALQL